jgi:cold shock CspA family protein
MFERQTGTVKRFGARHFGFIQPEGGGPDVFFRSKDSYDFLMGGDRVSFEINAFSDPRRPRAVDVRLVHAS